MNDITPKHTAVESRITLSDDPYSPWVVNIRFDTFGWEYVGACKTRKAAERKAEAWMANK